MYLKILAFATLATACLCAVPCAAKGKAYAPTYAMCSIDSGNLGTWGITKRGTERFLTSNTESEGAKGIVTSPAFTISIKSIKLTVRGWDGPRGDGDLNRFELIDAASGAALRTIKAPLSDGPNSVELDVADLSGRKVCFKCIDSSFRDGYGWIGVDNIDAGPDFKADFTQGATLKGWSSDVKPVSIIEKYGIPFLTNEKSVTLSGETITVPLGFPANRLLLLGMNVPDSRDYFIGNKLGDVRVVYTNGEADTFPLIHGESLWWGKRFFIYREPFTSLPSAHKAFVDSLKLYPQAATKDGQFISSVPTRKDVAIKQVELVDDLAIDGAAVIMGVSVELPANESAPGFQTAAGGKMPKDLQAFLASHPLRLEGVDEDGSKKRLNSVRNAMYCTNESFPSDFKVTVPKSYTGPRIRFTGDPTANLITNIFLHNAEDMSEKVDADGTYHTSTKGAAWYGYGGFGCFTIDRSRSTRMHADFYYDEAWTRDLGRCLNELILLGYLDKAKACADWCLKMSKVWVEDKSGKLTLKGQKLPPHIYRILQMPSTEFGRGCFENDGHGLTSLFIYNLWRRMPDRDQWLRSRWKDIKALGDWPAWQLAHPEISQASDVLWSDSEGTGWDGTVGSSIFCDLPQIEMLYGFSEMAASIGQDKVAQEWKKTADGLKAAAEKTYLEKDPQYGLTWTTKTAGFGIQGCLAGILIPTDNHGLDTYSNYPEWRSYNEIAYRRCKDGFGLNAMGYGQGFIIQSALLLDKMQDAYELFKMTSKAVYNPSHRPYIVPEGVQLTDNGQTVVRGGDLGNGVQQAEIVKSARVIAGVDDCSVTKLRIFPRLPLQWNGVSVSDMPIVFELDGKRTWGKVGYDLKRTAEGATMKLRADCVLPEVSVRLGAFSEMAAPRVLINGKEVKAEASKSGDSYWVSATVPQGSKGFSLDVSTGPPAK